MTSTDPPAAATRPRTAVFAEARRAQRWREIPRRMADGSPSIRSLAVIRSSGRRKLRVNGTSASLGLAGERHAGMCPWAAEPDRVRVAGGRPACAELRDPDREPGRVRLDHQVTPDNQADMARRGGRAIGTGEEHQVTGFLVARLDP